MFESHIVCVSVNKFWVYLYVCSERADCDFFFLFAHLYPFDVYFTKYQSYHVSLCHFFVGHVCAYAKIRFSDFIQNACLILNDLW